MNEQYPEQDAQLQGGQWESSLEQRLHAYYGPPLRERLLAQPTWQKLHHKLGQQQRPHRKIDWKHRFRRRRNEPVPEYIRTAFMQVVYEARIPYMLPALRCSFKKRAEPSLYIAPGVKPYLQ